MCLLPFSESASSAYARTRRAGRSLVVLLVALLSVTVVAIVTIKFALQPSEEDSKQKEKPVFKNSDAPAKPSDSDTNDDSPPAAATESGAASESDNVDSDNAPSGDDMAVPETPTGAPNSKDDSESEKSGSEETKPTFDTSGNWSSRRLIALARRGPYVIDLKVAVGHDSLESASERLLAEIAEELQLPRATEEMVSDTPTMNATMQPSEEMAKSEVGPEPMTWQALLDHPLVQSGWLGNLIADDEQEEQLIGMYDTERDDIVGEAELQQFLSRGLSRSDSLQVSESGTASGLSPWGPADADDDFLLSEKELDQISEALSELDRDGNGSITREETVLTAERPAMSMQSSLLQSRTLHQVEGVAADLDSDEKARLRAFANPATRILQHYTFLSEVPRDQWQRWSDTQWTALDKDGNNSVDRYEMQRIVYAPAHATIFIRLPSNLTNDKMPSESSGETTMGTDAGAQAMKSATAATAQMYCEFVDPEAESEFSSSGLDGQLRATDFLLRLEIADQFNESNRERLKQALESGLANAQVRAGLRQQLELGSDGILLADADGDKKISKIEMDSVWRWLSARQSARLLGRWTLANSPWFVFIDQNGSGVLEASELEGVDLRMSALDQDGSNSLAPTELPLVVQLTLNRRDTRMEGLGNVNAGESPDAPAIQDWFDAMDLNGDSAISLDEFLGDKADFEPLDVDGDGFIRRDDLY